MIPINKFNYKLFYPMIRKISYDRITIFRHLFYYIFPFVTINFLVLIKEFQVIFFQRVFIFFVILI